MRYQCNMDNMQTFITLNLHNSTDSKTLINRLNSHRSIDIAAKQHHTIEYTGMRSNELIFITY